MLCNLNDPTFYAHRLIKGLIIIAQQMSVSPSPVRAELLGNCLPVLEELRDMAIFQFSSQAVFITAAIDEMEVALGTLAELGGGQIVEDHRDGSGICPVCGTAITISRYAGNKWVYCRKCCKPVWSPIEKLCGFDGFRTDAI